MIKTKHCFACCLTSCIVAVIAASASAAVNIELQKNAVVRRSTVTLGDIARLTGGGTSTLKRYSKIDLTSLKDTGDEETISASLVTIRLLLAGFANDDFVIDGASETTIRRIENATVDEAVIESARTALAESWGIPVEQISVQLTRPLQNQVSRLEGLNIEVSPILSGVPKVGPSQIRFGAYEGGKLLQMFTASVLTTVKKELAIARVQIR
ncbi:MAG: hypothetical protein KDB27_27735, partial [Planctomycetales bacterium]|nr:hypothetical protein [Planctomycetales bacterium]